MKGHGAGATFRHKAVRAMPPTMLQPRAQLLCCTCRNMKAKHLHICLSKCLHILWHLAAGSQNEHFVGLPMDSILFASPSADMEGCKMDATNGTAWAREAGFPAGEG